MNPSKFEPSYDSDQFNEDEPKDIEYHFFGASADEGKTDVDYQNVFKWFAEQEHTFNMFFVPTHAQADYKIYHGRPIEVGAHWLGTYHFNHKE